MAIVSRSQTETRTGSAAAAAGREVAIVLALWLGYSGARLLGGQDRGTAFANAHRLLTLERSLHLDLEAGLNAWLTRHELAEVVAAYWYSAAHYLVTAVVLVFLWRRHREQYYRARTVLVGATLIALVCYLLLPMAPPRLLPGYIDTLNRTANWGWWSAQGSVPRGLGSLTNDLAAMPSMHVGWALWVPLVLTPVTRRRWLRVLLWLYPLASVTAVVVTANHWVLDAVAGATVVLGVYVAVNRYGSVH